jgi:hypothetical protein
MKKQIKSDYFAEPVYKGVEEDDFIGDVFIQKRTPEQYAAYKAQLDSELDAYMNVVRRDEPEPEPKPEEFVTAYISCGNGYKQVQLVECELGWGSDDDF